MSKTKKHIRDGLITTGILVLSFIISLLFQNVFGVEEHITTVFVFAVFLISLITNGYLFGMLSALVGTIAVNWAFTFPYFAIDFYIPVNLISAVIMGGIAILTSAFTTKLKQHEMIKIESERERMRANLLRAISHDLRTPLTTIYASSTTLLENDDMITKEQRKKIVGGIKEDSEWLVRMFENLLSVTKIDSGQVKIIKVPIVLDELIDSVMIKFKKRYPAQKVDLEVPEDVITIPMDAILIEQVILNILENAVQHAMGMTSLALSVHTTGEKAVFEIRDNGKGLNPKNLDTIFSGYYVSNQDIADSQKKNAGIGLSVCSSIIKAHGGTIQAENSKTGGAVFRFELDME